MKNKLVLSALLAAGFAGAAQAQLANGAVYNEVYITGSTAFRAEVFNVLNGKIAAPSTPGDAGKPKSVNTSSANQYNFQGTWANDGSPLANQNVRIYASFTGSVDGQGALVGVAPYATVTYTNFTGVAGTFTGTAQLAFSDVTQSSAQFASSPALVPTIVSGKTGVGVIPFVFARINNAKGAKITNISDNQAQNLATAGGFLPLSFLTGDPADLNDVVYFTGRNSLSGTRTAVFADTLIGITTSVIQTHNAASYTLNGDQSTTRGANTANPTDFPSSPEGWSSGSLVRADLNNTLPSDAWVGYMGIADSNSLTLPGQKLNYNGVPFSLAAVRNGSYTLWSYVQLYSKNGDTTSYAVTTFKPGFVTALQADLATSTLASSIGDMKVKRNADGAPVLPN